MIDKYVRNWVTAIQKCGNKKEIGKCVDKIWEEGFSDGYGESERDKKEAKK